MKKINLFTKFRSSDVPKGARPWQLRLENLEERQLLSVTDIAALAAASDNVESVQYTMTANVSDAVIDVSSVLVTTGTAALDALTEAGVAYDAHGATTDDGVTKLTVTQVPSGELSLAGFDNLYEAYVNNCGLTNLDASTSANLRIFECFGNNLTTLDLPASTKLTSLNCHSNLFETLDLRANNKLYNLTLDYDVKTLFVGRYPTGANSVTISLANLPADATVQILDSAQNNIPCTNGQFELSKTTPGVVDPVCVTTDTNGVETQMLINPMLTLDEYSGSAFYVDANKEMTNVNLFGVTEADLKLTVGSYTVEESAAYVEVANSKLIYKGGLDASAMPYVVTITAESGEVAQSVEYGLTINPWTLAEPSGFNHAATADSITVSWDAVPYADYYVTQVYAGGQLQKQNMSAANSYAATGLTSKTEYEFRVQACSNDTQNVLDSAVATYTASTLPNYTLTVTPIVDLVVYNTDVNVAVADFVTTDFDAPVVTVDNDAFGIVGSQVVFLGGASGTYNLTVTATEGEVVRSDTLTVTVNQAQLDTPTGFGHTSTASSITYTWDAVPNATGYDVVIDGTHDTTDTNSYTATGLASDTRYEISVVATAPDMVDSAAATYTAAVTLNPTVRANPIGTPVYNTDTNVAVALVELIDFSYPDITVNPPVFAYDNAGSIVFVGGASGDYNVTVTAEEGEIVRTDTFAVTVHQAQLDTPVNLSAASTIDTITFTWDAVPNATGYSFVFGGTPGTTETNSYTATGLASNTAYEFSVSATAPDMVASAAASLTASTLRNYGVTATPIAVTVYNTDANVAVADVTTTDFDAPVITVDNDAFGIVGSQVVFLGGASGTYNLTVTATEGEVVRSDTLDVTVYQAQLDTPVNLSAASTIDTITFTWDAVANATGYSFVFGGTPGTTETNSYTATGLASNTAYEFSVSATAPDMVASAAASLTASTLRNYGVTVAPIAVTVYNTDTNVAVADVVTTDFDSPVITVDNDAFGIVGSQVVFVGGASGIYNLTVSATEGEVVRSDTLDVIVHQAQLAAPANLRATAVTSSSVTLAWDAVPNATGYAYVFDGASGATDTNSYTATGLASDTEYLFQVWAFGDDKIDSDIAERTVRTSAEAAGAWATLSTDSPAFGDTVVANIAPDSTATYAWYSVDADNVETQLSYTTSHCYVASNDLLGKYLKAVVTYTSGEFAGQEVSVMTANTVTRLTPPVKIAAAVPYIGKELVSYTTLQIATVDYQWYRVANDVETAIDGATSRFYTVTEADFGFYLKVVVTGTGAFIGSTSATTQVPVVAECPLTLSTLNPVLGGRIQGYLNPADSFATYQWQVYDEALDQWEHIEGATYSYFTPSYGLVGKYLRLRATYQRFENAGLSVSVATNRVERPIISVSISGDEDLQVGSELTTAVVYKYATADYQWYRGAAADGDAWTAIDGATAKTYTVTDADKGYYLKVVATGTGVFSGVVEDVTAEPVYVERLSFVTGEYPQLGERIQVALNPAGPATYAWSVVDGQGVATAIPDCSASYWTPSYDHVGYTVRVTATYLSGDFAGQSFTIDTADVVTRDVSKMQITLYPDSGRFVGERVGAYVVPTYATVTYQWYRVDAEDVETLIDGATNKRYTTTVEDAGFRMKVVATGVHPYVNSNSAITSYVVAFPDPAAELDEDVFDLLALSILD